MKLNRKILIVGFGDVGERLAKMLTSRYRVMALVRKPDRAQVARSLGVTPVFGDLDDPQTLDRIGGIADIVCHFAPPPLRDTEDSRTRHLIAALHRNRALMLPQRLVYISTTGVYGDCQGEWITETRAVAPGTERAIRRVHAENLLRQWGTRSGVKISILRAPGIYARDRLPIERLQKRTPALIDADDVFTNHIHAEDLARAAMAAITRGRANRVYNAVDDTDMKMGDYFDLVADRFGFDRAPRLSRDAAAAVISAPMMSFMGESRRIQNNRVKRELGFDLKYPTVAEFLSGVHGESGEHN